MIDGVSSLHGGGLPPLPGEGPGLPPSPFGAPQQMFGAPGMQFQIPNGIPEFYVEVKRKADGTYENVEYVNIKTPGDPKAMPARKVTDHIRMKYRQHYELWKRDQTMAPVGTPLEMWPRMTPAMVHQLKAANIFTVEQLASVSDDNLRHVPFGLNLRKEARLYAEAKEKSDVIEQATAKTQAMEDGMRMLEQRVESERATMQAENADLRAKLDALLTRLSAPETAPVAAAEVRRGPGRPPKAEAA